MMPEKISPESYELVKKASENLGSAVLQYVLPIRNHRVVRDKVIEAYKQLKKVMELEKIVV